MIVRKWKAFCHVFECLRYVLTARQKWLGIVTFFMSVVCAVLQMLGVYIIVPIVGLMTDPDQTLNNQSIQLIRRFLGIKEINSLFVCICIGAVALYIIKNLFCIFQLWVSTKYANLVERELAIRIMDSYMHRTYGFFLRYDSAKILRDAEQDPQQVNFFIRASFNICNEFLTTIMIILYIVMADWKMASCLGAVALLCILILYRFFKTPMKRMGVVQRETWAMHQRVFQEAIGGIKEVQVMRKQEFFLRNYRDTYVRKQKPMVYSTVATISPTYLIEGIFVSGIVIYLCLSCLLNPSFSSMVPLLASFAMGAIRMLPALGRISVNLNTISFSTPAVLSMAENLKSISVDDFENNMIHSKESQVLATDYVTKSEFLDTLTISSVCWHYLGTDRQILQDIDLIIRKGQSIGIVGQTGSGKSTLADVILGLHVPQKGKVLIDGVDIFSIPDDYARIIGYVPQSIFLVDGSIKENVAFGEELSDVKDEEIWAALEQAQLAEFVRTLEDGLNTIIGERGVRFSGGQRQRLAIARALYRKPQILVLDEATSALDNETEAAVMDAIEHLYGTITMIIIAHRLTTVAKCDAVYEIRDGKAVKTNL